MKFLVFLAVVAAIWYGARWIRQVDAMRRAQLRPQPRATRAGGVRQRTVPRATETVLCARCGIYVPADVATACGRKDCPFPAARRAGQG